MKSLLVIALLSSFLFVVLFGFLAMSGDMHQMPRCFAAALQGKECPQAVSSVALAGFHINVLKLFSTAILVFLSFISLLFISFLSPFVLAPSGISQGKRAPLAEIAFLPLRKQMRWLRRIFHSPTSFWER